MPQALETYSGLKLMPVIPDYTLTQAVRFGPSQTIARGTVMAQKTTDGLLYPYNSGLTSGLQFPIGFSIYDVMTDSSGNHFLSTNSAVASSLNPPLANVPIYTGGVFDPAELVGWNANALTVMKGRVYGATTYVIISV